MKTLNYKMFQVYLKIVRPMATVRQIEHKMILNGYIIHSKVDFFVSIHLLWESNRQCELISNKLPGLFFVKRLEHYLVVVRHLCTDIIHITFLNEHILIHYYYIALLFPEIVFSHYLDQFIDNVGISLTK